MLGEKTPKVICESADPPEAAAYIVSSQAKETVRFQQDGEEIPQRILPCKPTSETTASMNKRIRRKFVGGKEKQMKEHFGGMYLSDAAQSLLTAKTAGKCFLFN